MDAGRFVFHGMITGTSDAGITQTFRFHGKGTVSLNFGNNDWFSTNYKFDEASAAAVEPGTLLLFGSGAVATLVRRRRQRQHE